MLRSVAVGVTLAGCAATASSAASTPTITSRPVIHGGDVSWPNCAAGQRARARQLHQATRPAEPMPTSSARFVVVGLTNGPGFHRNKCLAGEVLWVKQRGLRLAAYSMTTYPSAKQVERYAHAGPFTGHTTRAALRNTGYAEARFNVATMGAARILVPMVWVDVEPYNPAWSSSVRRNRAVVTGVMRGYRDAGFNVGIYTNPNGWPQVVGHWQLPDVPTWTTVGPRGQRKALRSCRAGPSGGATWLAQWWSKDGHHDFDLTCPYAPPRLTMFAAL